MAVRSKTQDFTEAPPKSSTGKHRQASVKLLLIAVGSIWAYGWAESIVLTIQFGRYIQESLSAVARSSVVASAINDITILFAIASLTVAISLSIANLRFMRLGFMAALLAPWLILYPGYLLLRDSVFSFRELLFPLFILAVCLVRPTVLELCRFVVRLCLITSIAAICMGIIAPSISLMPQSWNVDKQLVGESILAGMYGHSNQLGTILALSLPLVIGVYRDAPKKRNLYIAMILAASVWSASRVSLLSVVVFFAVLFVAGMFQMNRSPSRGVLIWICAILVAVSVAIWLPMTTEDPLAYTNRGLIWQTSLEFWSESPWLGWGPDILSSDNALTWLIGARPNTSHNVWLTFATAGGVLALVAFAVAAALVTVRAVRLYRCDEPTLLLFVVMLALLGVAEDPVRVLHLGPQAFIVWTGLALAMCAMPPLSREGSSPVVGSRPSAAGE